MSQNTSNANVAVKTTCSDECEERILAAYKNLHHLVLNHIVSTGGKATFMEDFSKCGTEDYKVITTVARGLIVGKRAERKEKRVAGIRTAVASVVATYMDRARAAKAQFDALKASMGEAGAMLPAFSSTVRIPLSDIRSCFPQGASDTEVLSDLEYLGYKVTDMTTKGNVLVPFKTEEPKVSEEAPKSEKTAKAA